MLDYCEFRNTVRKSPEGYSARVGDGKAEGFVNRLHRRSRCRCVSACLLEQISHTPGGQLMFPHIATSPDRHRLGTGCIVHPARCDDDEVFSQLRKPLYASLAGKFCLHTFA